MRYELRQHRQHVAAWLRFAPPLFGLLLALATSIRAAEPNPTGAEPMAVDILASNRGIAKSSKLRAENIDPSTDNEFLDFSQAFVKKDGEWILTIPATDAPEKYRYVGFGPMAVEPLHRYSLVMESTNLATDFKNIARVTFLKGDTRTHFVSIGYAPSSEFGTPPDADRMVVWLGVSAWPNTVAPGPKVGFRSLKLADLGPMRGAPISGDAQPGENLLPVSDFESEPLGAFTNRAYFYAGHGVISEIVSGESKCLHLVKGAHDYVYPYFNSRKIDLNGCSLLFTCRIKGKGKVSPGIWWWLKGVKGTAWAYYHGDCYDLTDTWQTVRVWRACLAATDFATCDFNLEKSPEVDLYVDDLSLTIIR